MSNFTIHFVISKRVTLHARIGSGSDGNVINFDSDELPISDERHRLHQVLVHIKYVLIRDVACMVIDNCDDLRVIRLATHMLNRNHRSKELRSGLKYLSEFLCDVSMLK